MSDHLDTTPLVPASASDPDQQPSSLPEPAAAAAAAAADTDITNMTEQLPPVPGEPVSVFQRGCLNKAYSSNTSSVSLDHPDDADSSGPATPTHTYTHTTPATPTPTPTTPGPPTTPTTSTTTPPAKRRLSCPSYFGVRSYLHQFYDESASYKDPAVYEDDDSYIDNNNDDRHYHFAHHRTYYQSRGEGRRRCSPIWWKVFLWVGVVLLMGGVLGILVGYLVSPRPVIVGENKEAGEWYVDLAARRFNTALDACKLIGLGLFCLGGVTLALSLLFPSFLHYCHEEYDEDGFYGDGDEDDDSKVPLQGSAEDEAGGGGGVGRGGGGGGGGGRKGVRFGPVREYGIPASSEVRAVQPVRKAPRSMLASSQS